MAARGQNQGKGKNKLTYAPKPKIPPPPKRENPTKDSICHECGETGHWKRNCPQYLAELLKKKNTASGASGSGIFTIELNTFLNRLWIYDTGYGTHIFNTTQGLRASRKLKSGDLLVTSGQWSSEPLKHIAVVNFMFPFVRDGFVNCFVDIIHSKVSHEDKHGLFYSAILEEATKEPSRFGTLLSLCDCRLDTISARRKALR
ncbi:zinc finger, CCHC-type containing protein [Tanacetum coccineum]